jgi:hypothetical protein
MKKLRLLLTIFALTIAAPAASTAASSSCGEASGSASMQQGGASPRVVQKLHDNLTKAGFSDVQIMPQSFLVRAKDSDGNPVMMVVNQDSVTAVTALGGLVAGQGTSPAGKMGAMSSGSSANGSGTMSSQHSGSGGAGNH